MIDYHDLTREERARMIIEDFDTYKELVPEGHWLQLLDGLAKTKAYEAEVGISEAEDVL